MGRKVRVGGERLVEGDFGGGAGFDDEGAGGVGEDAVAGEWLVRGEGRGVRERAYWPAAALLKAWRVVGSKAWVDMVVVVVCGFGDMRREGGGREGEDSG